MKKMNTHLTKTSEGQYPLETQILNTN